MPPFSEDLAVISSVSGCPFREINHEDGPSPLPLHQRSDSNTTVVQTKQESLAPIAKRSVTFYPYGEVVDIDTLDEYTDAEIQDCWYDEDEIANIKSENQHTIRRISRGVPRADDCIRGLESQLHSGYLSSRKIKDNSIVAVLSEQYKQHQIDISSAELIRKCYMYVTKHAVTKAVEAARHDAMDAQTIHRQSLPISKPDEPRRRCWFLDPSFWLPRIAENPIVDMDY